MSKKTRKQIIDEISNLVGLSLDEDYFREKFILGDDQVDFVTSSLRFMSDFIARNLDFNYFYSHVEDGVLDTEVAELEGVSMHEIAKRLHQLADKITAAYEKDTYWCAAHGIMFEVPPCTKADLVRIRDEVKQAKQQSALDRTKSDVKDYVKELGAEEVLRRIEAEENRD